MLEDLLVISIVFNVGDAYIPHIDEMVSFDYVFGLVH